MEREIHVREGEGWVKRFKNQEKREKQNTEPKAPL